MKNERKPLTLPQLIGSQIRRIRESSQTLQEQIAQTARERFGLEWTQATVAAIETGKRNLSVEEFLLLPMILSFAQNPNGQRIEPFVELADLFPNSHDIVKLNKSTFAANWRLLQIVQGKASDAWGMSHNASSGGGGWMTPGKGKALAAMPESVKQLIRQLGEVESTRQQIASELPVSHFQLLNEAAGEAEKKIARKFHLSPSAVAILARKKWNRSLTEERDARIGVVGNDPDPRRRQALRGHVTRELIEELAPELKKLSKQAKGRTRQQRTEPHS